MAILLPGSKQLEQNLFGPNHGRRVDQLEQLHSTVQLLSPPQKTSPTASNQGGRRGRRRRLCCLWSSFEPYRQGGMGMGFSLWGGGGRFSGTRSDCYCSDMGRRYQRGGTRISLPLAIDPSSKNKAPQTKLNLEPPCLRVRRRFFEGDPYVG